MMLAWLSSAARAETPSLVVLYVNPQGQWDRTVQEKWEAAGGFTAPTGMRAVPWAQALSPRLAGASRETLLRWPEMLLSSSRRAEVFAVRYVVLDRWLHPDNGRSSPVVFDTTSGARVVLPDIKHGDLKASEAALSTELSAGLAQMNAPVWGNVTAKIYHVVGCDHVRQDQTIVIDSEQEALRNGYEPCAICFASEKDFRKRNGTEQSLGREVASAIERRYHVANDPNVQARVERVGRRLIDANGLQDFNFTFRVLEMDEPNAFAAGAGAIYITRGLEKLTEGDDDMLAAVLGHEIGHTEEHHVLRQYRQAQTWSILGTIASVATGVYWPGILSDLIGGVVGRGNGRGFELEADRLGVIYAYDAGYRPEDFILVINALKKLSPGKGTPSWLRTHPTEEKRLERTRALVARLSSLDALVTSWKAQDPGMAAYIRRHGVMFVDRQQELGGALPLFVAALQGLPPGAAPGVEGKDSQGVGGPSVPSSPQTTGTRVVPGPDGGTRFTHD
jgi:hypothetical protein